MGFVTAFRGRRDGYEIPIALAERGQLDGFVTDFFAGAVENGASYLLPLRLAEKVRSRGDQRIPPETVVRLRGLSMREALFRFMGGSREVMYRRYDAEYGHAAAAIARRHHSDLFMYSSYAEPAFTARYRHTPRKILFQFHPHADLENRLLREGAAAVARRRNTDDPVPDLTIVENVGDDAWRLADQIVCASTFTRRSLIEVGADPKRINVVPYGVYLPPPVELTAPTIFHALFVGSGVLRKGLHHLIAAWRKARLPAGSRLTIVARTIIPELMKAVDAAAGIEFLPGVGIEELSRLYATATLFVMPSLVEGFGQVYLEALAHGLPVLGTANTCVPDLGKSDEGVFLTDYGQSDALAADLEHLAGFLPGNIAIKERARAVAERNSWAGFREGIGRIINANE